MGFKDRLKDIIAPEDEEELELNKDEAESISIYEETSGPKINADANIVLFEPRRFEEAEEIGKHLKSKRACCVNLHRMPNEYRTRAVDFLSGVVYGLDGSIKKIGEDVVLCSPKNLQVGGDISLTNFED